MTDETDRPGGEGDPLATLVVPTPEATGNQLVDGVISAIDGLDDRPLAEHVTVFEQAHERLRAALDGRPVMPPAPSQQTGDA